MSRRRRPQKRLALDFRFLLTTGLPALVVLVAIVAWYLYQDRQLQGSLLERSAALEAEEEYAKAADYLHQYLQTNPDDADIIVRFAEAFDKGNDSSATRSHAINLYQRALGVADEGAKPHLRARLAELLLQVGRASDSQEQAVVLCTADPKSPAGLKWLAISLIAQYEQGKKEARDIRKDLDSLHDKIAGFGPYAALSALFEAALHQSPKDPQLTATLARMYRVPRPQAKDLLDPKWFDGNPERQNDGITREARADELIDTLVAGAESKDAESQTKALLLRHAYRNAYHLEGAEADLQRALEIAPESREARLRAAQTAFAKYTAQLKESGAGGTGADGIDAKGAHTEKADTKTADTYLNQAREYCASLNAENPADAQAALLLGQIELAERNWKEAVRICEACLKLRKGSPDFSLTRFIAEQQIRFAPRDSKTEESLQRFETALNIQRTLAEQRLLTQRVESLNHLRYVLRGDFHAGRGDLDTAIDFYRRLVVLSDPTGLAPGRRRQVWTALGNAYLRNGQADRAAACFDAIIGDPEIASGRAAFDAARAWLGAGRPDRTVERCRKALETADSSLRPEILLLLAGAQLRLEASKPRSQQSWKSIDDTIAALGKFKPDAWADSHRLVVLKIDLLGRRQEEGTLSEANRKTALGWLKDAETTYSDDVDALREFARVYERLGASEEADRLAGQAKRLAKSPAFDAILDSEFAMRRQGPEAARKIVQDALAKADEQTSPFLETQLRMIARMSGDAESSKEELVAMHEEYPRRTEPLRFLCEIALSEGDLKAAQDWETRLREIEGDDGFFWRYFRVRRLLAVEDDSPTRLQVASDLFAKIKSRRPDWVPLNLLGARLDAENAANRFENGREKEESGDIASAEAEYKEAATRAESGLNQLKAIVELDDESRRLRDGLVGLLIRSRSRLFAVLPKGDRAPRLETLVASVREFLPKTGTSENASAGGIEELRVLRTLFETLLREKRTEDARAMLEAFAQCAPDGFKNIGQSAKSRFLGEGYGILGETDEAEKHFRAAIETADESEKAAAERRLAVFIATHDASPSKEAEGIFKKLLADDPEDYRAQMGLLQFHLDQGNTAEARRILEGLASIDELSVFTKALARAEGYSRLGDNAKVEECLRAAADAIDTSRDRSALLSVLLERGDDASLKIADSVLRSAPEPDSVPIRRARYRVLLRRGPERATEAKAILEELAARDDRSAGPDCLALASVLEKEGDADAARRMYERAVRVSDSAPETVAALAQFLLRREDREGALAWAEKLENIAPGAPAFALKVECFKALNRNEDIDRALKTRETELLKQAGKNDSRQAAALVSLGSECMRLERFEQAEGFFRRAVEFDRAAKAALGSALMAQKRTDAALTEVLDLFNSEATAANAMAVFAILSRMKAGELSANPRIDAALEKAVAAFPENVRILLEAGGVRLRQNRHDDAISLYEKALAVRPQHPATLNNLAALLAYKPDRLEEALGYADKALAVPANRNIPAVLDTKGTVLLAMGRTEEAIQWFEKATAGKAPEPAHLLHAAVAYSRMKRFDDAKAALARASERGLDEAELDEKELQLKNEVEKVLK